MEAPQSPVGTEEGCFFLLRVEASGMFCVLFVNMCCFADVAPERSVANVIIPILLDKTTEAAPRRDRRLRNTT